MRLVRLDPTTPAWSALIALGAGEYLGEKPDTEFWAICAPEPIGVLGFEQLSGDACECDLWVRPDVRGRWWTRSFYSMLLGIGFAKAKTIIAAVMEGSASHRMVERLGWEKYCQQGGLSYYHICKERLNG